jgi:hypothetical protein
MEVKMYNIVGDGVEFWSVYATVATATDSVIRLFEDREI